VPVSKETTITLTNCNMGVVWGHTATRSHGHTTLFRAAQVPSSRGSRVWHTRRDDESVSVLDCVCVNQKWVVCCVLHMQHKCIATTLNDGEQSFVRTVGSCYYGSQRLERQSWNLSKSDISNCKQGPTHKRRHLIVRNFLISSRETIDDKWLMRSHRIDAKDTGIIKGVWSF
jgi:hypothetical protein